MFWIIVVRVQNVSMYRIGSWTSWYVAVVPHICFAINDIQTKNYIRNTLNSQLTILTFLLNFLSLWADHLTLVAKTDILECTKLRCTELFLLLVEAPLHPRSKCMIIFKFKLKTVYHLPFLIKLSIRKLHNKIVYYHLFGVNDQGE